jgi:hypothetical protein
MTASNFTRSSSLVRFPRKAGQGECHDTAFVCWAWKLIRADLPREAITIAASLPIRHTDPDERK